MKNYNDIYDKKQRMCAMMDEAYSKGYDTACDDCEIAIQDSYQKGLDDAWECVKKIWNMIAPRREKVFGTETLGDILDSYSVSEAMTKIKEHEEKQKVDEAEKKVNDEIKIGDEIINYSGDRGVVVALLEHGDFRVLWLDGTVSVTNGISKKKTGRHFNIPNILDQMRNEQ